MKKLFITLSCVFFFVAVSYSQIIRQQSNAQMTYAYSGSILGTIYIQKASMPAGVSINQIAQAVQQGLRAYAFVPQSSGGFAPHYSLVDNKTQALSGSTAVNVQATTTTFMIKYKISKLPIMKPMTVRMKPFGIAGHNFAMEPSLKSFPVAYLTNCDKVFECFNFSASFIPFPK